MSKFSDELKEKFEGYFLERAELAGLTALGVVYNGERIYRKTFHKYFDDEVKGLLAGSGLFEAYFCLSDKEKADVLWKAIKDAYKKQETNEASTNFDFSDYSILVESTQSLAEDKFVYSNSLGDVDYNLSFRALRDLIPNDKMFRAIPRYLARTFYSPTGTQGLTWENDGQNKVAVINLYQSPTWRSRETPHESLPSSARRFFEHLFPDIKSRTYVFKYLYQMLTAERGAEFILFLHF